MLNKILKNNIKDKHYKNGKNIGPEDNKDQGVRHANNPNIHKRINTCVLHSVVE